jgi:hypothetical protein
MNIIGKLVTFVFVFSVSQVFAANLDWTGQGRGLDGADRIALVAKTARPSQSAAVALPSIHGNGRGLAGAELIQYVSATATKSTSEVALVDLYGRGGDRISADLIGSQSKRAPQAQALSVPGRPAGG